MTGTPDIDQILDLILSPKRVAVIGLSRQALASPVSILTTLEDFGYEGEIFIINPRMSAIEGRNVYPTLADVPGDIDLAVISVARDFVPAVLRECVAKGIGAAIVITQGFADADDEGRRLQEELLEIVRDGDIRILGPNTIGVSNAFSGFTSSFIEVDRDETPVGIVSQSGLFIMGHNIINNEPAGFSMSVDLGNGCDIGISEVIDYYGRRPEIKVIQCHAEGIRDGATFVATAQRVARKKPIVMLKAGRSREGQRAVESHSGAAAGEMEIYSAAFRKAGVVAVQSAEELRLLSKAFVTYKPAKGRRVAIMSYSGGGAVLAIDAVEEAGLELAEIDAATIGKIRDLFPDWIEVGNPFDVWIPVSRDMQTNFPRILETIMEDDGVDAVICIYCSYSLPKYELFDCTSHIRQMAAKFPDKPIACWSYGLDIAGFTREIEKDGNAMVFPSLADAAGALSNLARYRESCESSPIEFSELTKKIDRRRGRARPLQGASQPGRLSLFTETFDVLEACAG